MIQNAAISEILSFKGNAAWSIKPDATVFEAVQLMSEKNIGALLVIENEKLVGIISERDYTRNIVLKGKSSKQTAVKEIISRNVIHVTPSHSVEDCLRLMTDAAPRLEAYTLSDWPEQLADLVEALVQKLAGGIKRYPAKGCLVSIATALIAPPPIGSKTNGISARHFSPRSMRSYDLGVLQ